MIDPQTGQELTEGSPSRLSIAIRRMWPLVLLVAIVAGGFTRVVTSQENSTYAATGKIVVIEPAGATNETSDVQTASALVTSDQTLSAVSGTTGIPYATLQQNVTSVPETGAAVVDVTTRAGTGPAAAALFDEVYSAFHGVAQNHPGSPGSRTYSIDPRVPTSPTSPTPTRDMLIAVVLALILGLGLAWINEIRRPTAWDTRYAATVLQAPLFGELPSRNRGRRSQAFTALALDLDELAPKGTHALAIGAARVGDMSVETVADLGRAFAAGGWRTVIVDGQSHGDGLTKEYAPAKARGLTDLLGRPEGDAAATLVPMGSPNLSLLPLGTAPLNRSQPNLGEQVGTVLEELVAQSDLVLVALPGLGVDAEARVIAARAEATLVVVRRRTPIAALLSLRERLELFHVSVIGFVRDDDDSRSRYFRRGGTKTTEQRAVVTKLRDPARLAERKRSDVLPGLDAPAAALSGLGTGPGARRSAGSSGSQTGDRPAG